ncbi:ROK family protein [Paenibacillus cymbidii]|uniref:ROK family protein n=1 Tax=Paenibacillus cymbidii TaxID=1639034 RepID=UPI001081440D|nr:ROK family protein [Paenibacillus cymbidii]
MKQRILLAFDVGGTQIKAAAVVEGAIVEASVSQYESYAERNAGEIIAHLADIAVDVLGKVDRDEWPVAGLGMAFPGPFDYGRGVCLIRGLKKFDSLYGLSIGTLLEKELRSRDNVKRRLSPSFGIRFENDAALFGLGEATYGDARGSAKCVCLTIGTGLGSCFLEYGRLVKEGEGVPDQGWLYNIPYQGQMADDCISKRGVLQLAEEMGLETQGRDVHDFASLAESGDPDAVRLFVAFGKRMASILTPALRRFGADSIVIGGQIAKSGSLFVPAFQEEMTRLGFVAKVKVSRHTLFSTLKGIYAFVVKEP